MMSPRDTLDLFDATIPTENARTIPACWYHDVDFADFERAIFTRSWLAIGRSEAIPNPGDYLTADVAEMPLLIVRGTDNDLRGFFNVCRHRAARVMTDCEGNATCLRCPYHGWTYDVEGKLLGATEFANVCEFDKEDNGLTPLHLDTWRRLLFAHAGEPQTSLLDFLNPIPNRLMPLNLESLHFAERRTYAVECNWKVFIDNYLDGGYHIPHVHPGLSGAMTYARYHTVMGEWSSLQIAPMDRDNVQGDSEAVANLRKGSDAFYGWVFPNFMINAYEGYMDTNLVVPVSPNRCQVVYDFYFESGTEKDEIAESIDIAEKIQKEDADICASVQRGLRSGAFVSGRYSIPREEPVHHFHRLLAQSLRASIVC